MWKLGIHRLEEIGPESKTQAYGRISYRLLETSIPPSDQEVLGFESIVYSLRLSNGVYRTTFPGRFADLDPILNRHLERHFAPATALHVEDWAASDCLASADWSHSLFPLFPNASLAASDLLLFLVEASLPSGESAVAEPSGALLQSLHGRFVVRLEPPEPGLFVINGLLARRTRKNFAGLPEVLATQAERLASAEAGSFDAPPFRLRKLPLIHPRAETLRRQDRRFTIRRHSIFSPLEKPCHAIRTMNILNRAYFSETQLRQGADTVFQSLLPGGLWIVGRTLTEHPFRHEVSILRRNEDGLELLERVGPGSEIEALALQCGGSGDPRTMLLS
jgi:hypothetical protein